MTLIYALLETTLYSAVLFFVITAFKAIFQKKLSPALNFAIWFILLARLLMPVTIDSGFHLFTAQATVEPAVEGPAVAASEPNAAAYMPYDEVPATSSAGTESPAAQPAKALQESAFTLTWAQALIGVWALGMALCAARLTYAGIKLNRRIASCGCGADARVRRIYAQLSTALGIRRAPPLAILPGIPSPALTVSLRPMVVLPDSVCVSLPDEQLGYTIAHELMHYRRGDHIVSLLLRLIETVYWFNPVVWLMKRGLSRDMETACDGAVTSLYDRAGRRAYALTLVRLFAQPQSGAYLLGMALTSTEKDAKRRILGVFKPQRSGMCAKAVAGLLCAVLFVGCFTTACQPTPEKEIVVIKDEGAFQQQPNAVPAPQTKYDAPAEYVIEPQSFYNGKITVSGTIRTDVPDVTAYPVYYVNDAPLSQEQVNKLCAALMQGQPLNYLDDVQTKGEIIERHLLPAQQLLARLEAGERIVDDSGELTIDSIKEQISMIETWIANAPENKDNRSLNVQDYAQMDNFSVQADLGKTRPARLQINKRPENYYTFKFIDDVEYIYNSPSQPAGDLPLKTTRQEAISQAEELVKSIGFDDFALFDVYSTTMLGSEIAINTEEYQSNMAYCAVFTRVVDGIQTTYGAMDSVSMKAEGDFSGSHWWYEALMVMVNDGGIANVIYKGNTQRTGVVNANAKLMDFPDMMQRALEQLRVCYGYIEDQPGGDGIRTDKIELSITGAKLGYMRVRVNNSTDCALVPVWDFYGVQTYHFNQADLKRLQDEDDFPLDFAPVQAHDSGSLPLLTINALDGSNVDRRYGY